MRVLIADDSKIVRERLVSLLSSLEEVTIVGQAENTIETKILIKELNPDVVTLDLRMPGGTGIDLLSNIKDFNPMIKVIILTSYNFPQYKEKCLNLGADYFLNKSEVYDRIMEIFEEIITKKKDNQKLSDFFYK
jgi:DNA-binding NarL/FixJ family response regulator